MIRTNFYITDNQTSELKNISRRTGMSVSEHVRRALDIYIAAWRKVPEPVATTEEKTDGDNPQPELRQPAAPSVPRAQPAPDAEVAGNDERPSENDAPPSDDELLGNFVRT